MAEPRDVPTTTALKSLASPLASRTSPESTSDAAAAALRKVRSLDCVRKPKSYSISHPSGSRLKSILPDGDSSDRDCSHKCSAASEGVAAAASRFSRAANRRRYNVPRILSSTSLAALSEPYSPLLRDSAEASTSGAAMAPSGAGWLSAPTRALNLSVFALLLIATMADVTRRSGRSAQRNHLQTADRDHGDKGRPRMGLGSAMIGSVTTALSPILPFAGGMDLRRGEHWGLSEDGKKLSGGWWSSSPSVADTVSEIPRGGADSTTNKRRRKKKTTNPSREAALSASDPFLPESAIAELTLGDVAAAFRYAVDSGREGANRKELAEGALVSQQAKKAMDAIDDATSRSRGKGVLPAKTKTRSEIEGKEVGKIWHGSGPISHDVGYGDVDALQFCAAMRLFAEWRILRQVPEGYKGYAVGMGLGHKDVVQNVAKIEGAVHDFLEVRWNEEWECDASCPEPEIRSPTLRELLQYELDHQIQTPKKLPRLKEKSAAMGLLWVRRQLLYQTAIFTNMLDMPSSGFPTAIDAVRAAYSEVYDSFHGWAVQKIFNYSFQAAPDAEVIYRHMNPKKLMEVTKAAQNGEINAGEVIFLSSESTEAETMMRDAANTAPSVPPTTTTTGGTIRSKSWDDEVVYTAAEEMNQSLLDGSSGSLPVNQMQAKRASVAFSGENIAHSEGNPLEKLASEWGKLVHHVGGECDKFGKHVGGEWDKLAHGVVKIFQKDNQSSDIDLRGGASRHLSGEALESYVTDQMALDARGHIVRYLGIVRPLLSDIAGLFKEMNMDDPTKV
eukprot:CAMPEP_0183294632 /NCGR_PEP_ID=MMETSP0160_2-20130417/2891_1 /TAXON_ID=2839 ORGANISM="Odontella Sinensis, Strain Grunow 1884" /NCGR_SAMPLE_ID=MMETSP0160_2 /ASSEMBLY_ACC=CAM_ASM_000250 /LENGTH=786 /DNA_ID=CAMNT_0025455985 /DNA_START=47 /DNA_END=2407 /DNA_ORIENTATION=+